MKNKLLLASGSQARQDLLRQAAIQFDIIHHSAQEDFDPQLPLEEIVSMLAIKKMAHVKLRQDLAGPVFVLTADTLVQDKFGKIQGKPQNREQALAQIKAISGKSAISTGFCLEKKQRTNTGWQTSTQIVQAVSADCYFEIPDSWIDNYLGHTPNFLTIAGALTIENYGAQFLKEIHGSYSAIMGLPLFEFRQALERIGFYK